MSSTDSDLRLASIRTRWSLLVQAHEGLGDARVQAQQSLLVRYHRGIYRYLLGIVRDADAAEDLAQEFAVRFLRGDFHAAEPSRGRFRDLLKTSLRHLVQDHWRRKARSPATIADARSTPAPAGGPEEMLERSFADAWREELLARAWETLAAEEQNGPKYYTVLHAKATRANLRSAQLAEELTAALGQPFSEGGIRQLLHRARIRFAEILVDEVAASLPTADSRVLEEELAELNLLDYCRFALERRGRPR